MDVHDFHKDFLEEIKATAATEGADLTLLL